MASESLVQLLRFLSVSIYIFTFVWSLASILWFRSWYFEVIPLFGGMIFSFPEVHKSLFPRVATRHIRFVKGSNYITTRWSKSYLISDTKECTFSNHDLIIINQLPNNDFDSSNVAYPIHLRNQINSNQDPIMASLRCYLYANCHYVVLIIVLTSNAQAVLWYFSKLSITAINSSSLR